MDSGKIVLGALAGLAVGASLGILFAPDKGTITRRRISRKGQEYTEDMQDKFTEMIEEMTRRFESMKDDAMHMVDAGKKRALAEMDHHSTKY